MPEEPRPDEFEELKEQTSNPASEPDEYPDGIEEGSALGQELILAARAHRDGLAKYYDLRERWSRVLAKLLCFLAVVQCALLLAIGRKWLQFDGYEELLKIQAWAYFGQIVSLCVVVVTFLFNDRNLSVLGAIADAGRARRDK